MRSLRSILLAGGAGFVGSSLVRHLLGREELQCLVVIDHLGPTSDRARLAGPDQDPRFLLVEGDLADRPLLTELLHRHQITGVFNLAVETASPGHVDGMIAATMTGTANLLASCRESGIPLLQCSTAEVYGSIAPPAKALETDRLAPATPRAALQAGADLLCQAFFANHGQDLVVTRSSNNYGPRQQASKLIPTIVRHAFRDEPITLQGGGMQIRDWIHVDDHCRGLLAAFLRGRPGHVYNFGGHCERTTIGLARSILQALGKPDSLLKSGPARQGRDVRQAIDTTKAMGFLGWGPQVKMPAALPTVLRSIVADLQASR